MKRTIRGLLVAGTACVLASTSALALDPAPKCQSSKLGTSAKYASCRLKADAKSVKTGYPVDYSRCSLAKFADAETRAGMDVCPSEGDQASIQDFLDACTESVAVALGGGALPDCDGDLMACEGDLSTTNADLTTCQGDLSTTNADLSSCENDLSTTNVDLAACEGDLAVCQANLGGLPKTGQTTAYGAGSDGDMERGEARGFTDNGDGTITDNATGLMWEKKSDDGSIHDKDNAYSWSTGTNSMDGTVVTDFLATLNGGGGFAGHTDWRIPNVHELQSLVNFEVPFPGPAVFSQFSGGCMSGCTVTMCSCTQSDYYWVTTTWIGGPAYAWVVDFYGGYSAIGDKTVTLPVRAVRAGS